MSDNIEDIDNLEQGNDILPLGDIEIDSIEDHIMEPLGDMDPLGDVNYICDPLGNLELYSEENMGPITDYRQLLEVIKYNQNELEQWYILLLFNPLNRTPAVDSFLNNYKYLNDRTGNVHYFIPGLKNDAQLEGNFYGPDWVRFQLSDNAPFAMLYDHAGLLETVKWLEESCPSYEYREGIDLILMKSYGQLGKAELDFKSFISIPLDEICRKGGNVIDAITFVRKIVINNLSFNNAQMAVQNYIEKASGSAKPSIVKVFIAGSKELYHERNVVRSQLQQISNRTDIAFTSYTYEDFSRSFIEDGQQTEYNKFIANQADFAIFIIDGRIGGITLDEFNVAMTSFIEKGKPRIFAYCKDVNAENSEPRRFSLSFLLRNRANNESHVSEIRHIIDKINEYKQYYCEYNDIYQLESCVHRDFMDVAWKLKR